MSDNEQNTCVDSISSRNNFPISFTGQNNNLCKALIKSNLQAMCEVIGLSSISWLCVHLKCSIKTTSYFKWCQNTKTLFRRNELHILKEPFIQKNKKILSSFIHTWVVPNLYDFLLQYNTQGGLFQFTNNNKQSFQASNRMQMHHKSILKVVHTKSYSRFDLYLCE